MKAQIENNISRVAEEARGRFFRLLDDARSRTVDAAGAVSKAKGPVKVVSKLGLKMTATSHKTADKVLRQQTLMVENQIDAFAGRLRAAAKAKDLRDLVSTQLRLIPQNAGRFIDDARETVTILTGAGQEMGSIVRGTVEELRGRKVTPAKASKAAKKKPAKKKVSKKTASKKTATAKTTKKAAKKKTAAKVETAATPADTQQAA